MPPGPGRPTPTALDHPVIDPLEAWSSLTRSAERLARVRFDLELDHAAGPLDLTDQIEAVNEALTKVLAARAAAERLLLAGNPSERTTVADALRLPTEPT